MIGEPGQAFAVIADVHGNADALRAVLGDIDRRGILQIVNLGDHLSGPLAAREAANMLMSREMISLRGNHDRYLITQTPAEMGPSDRAAFDELGAAHLDWLRGLPETLQPTPEIFLCHATPLKDDLYWMEHVGPDGLPNRRPRAEIAGEITAGRDAGRVGPETSLFLCGHSHIPRRLDLAGGTIFNPGSVGCPGYDDDHPAYHVMETGTPCATYGIVERLAHGWSTCVVQVPYDGSRMAALAARAGRGDWAEAVATGWIGGAG